MASGIDPEHQQYRLGSVKPPFTPRTWSRVAHSALRGFNYEGPWEGFIRNAPWSIRYSGSVPTMVWNINDKRPYDPFKTYLNIRPVACDLCHAIWQSIEVPYYAPNLCASPHPPISITSFPTSCFPIVTLITMWNSPLRQTMSHGDTLIQPSPSLCTQHRLTPQKVAHGILRRAGGGCLTRTLASNPWKVGTSSPPPAFFHYPV